MAGDRTMGVAERILPVVEQGLAVASVSYRFSDAATHPAQVQDARSAVGWLRANASRFGLASERIGAWGVSAGGWIALMLLLTPESDPGCEVNAACAWFPVTDLLAVSSDRAAAGLPLPALMASIPFPDPSMEARLLGLETIDADPAAARDASPLTHAANAAGPVLLIHGDGDGHVNAAQSIRLHDALTRAGRDSQLFLLRGANHQDAAFDTPTVLGATAAFFTAALG